MRWAEKRSDAQGDFGAAVGIGWERDGELVAGVVYNDFNGPNICMHVQSDGSRRWLTRGYLRVLFDYPFNQAGAHRITGFVGEGNHDARRFDEHLGFRLETRLRGAHPTGDLLVYVMRREDCRWVS